MRVLTDLGLLVLMAVGAGALLFALCAPLAEAGRSRPTIEARFTASCIQGTPCAAPAVVYLDARGTTDDRTDRPFHALRYVWHVEGVSEAGQPPDGPLSAVVIDRPGEHVVMLRAEHDGEASLAAQRVVVLDRSAVRVVELAAGSRQASVALGAGPGLLTTRGDGPPAVVTGTVSPPDGWTLARVDLEGGCLSLPPERSGITLIDVTARGCRQGALVTQTGGGTQHSDRIAVARARLGNAAGAAVPAIFARAARLVVIDSELRADYYPLRTVHFPGLVLARSRLETSASGHNAIQLRAWGGSGPPNDPSERFVVVDNDFSAASPATALVRTCETNTCDASVPSRAPVRDGIFRGNRLRMTGTGAPPPSIGFLVEGSGLTIDANEIEAPRANMATAGTVRLVQQFGRGGDRVQVRGNRARLPAGSRGAVACELVGAGHVCDANEIERVP